MLPRIVPFTMSFCQKGKALPAKIWVLISQNFHQFAQDFPSIQLKAIKDKNPAMDLNEQLAHFFNIDTLPAAALGALGANLQGKNHYWLRADPVELYADLAQVYLMGNKHLDLKFDEVKAFISYLNKNFQSENMQFFAVKNLEWYINIDFEPEVKTFPISQVEGKNIYNFLPTGQQKNFWQKWLTEVQMLLQSAPVNKQRKLMQQAQINSLWLWGEGGLADFEVNQSNFHIVSNDAVVLGLAKFLQWHLEKFEQCIKNFSSDEYLFVINPEVDDKKLIAEQFTIFKKANVTVEFLDGKVCKLKRRWQKIFNFLSSRK